MEKTESNQEEFKEGLYEDDQYSDDEDIQDAEIPIPEEAESKPKVAIVIHLENFACVKVKPSQNDLGSRISQLSLEPQKQEYIFRPEFNAFLRKILKHPRALVVFKINSKDESEAIMRDFKALVLNSKGAPNEVDNDNDQDLDDMNEYYCDWYEATMLSHNDLLIVKSSTEYFSSKILDLSKITAIINEALAQRYDDTKLGSDHLIFIEPESRTGADNSIKVHSITYSDIEKLISNPDPRPNELYFKDSDLSMLYERIFEALETDDVGEYVRLHPVVDESDDEDEQDHIDSKMIMDYPDIDINEVINHPEIEWLFRK